MNKRNIDNSFSDIVQKLDEIKKQIEELLPYAEEREVKSFTRAGHITLPKELIGRKVKIIGLPKKETY